MMATPISVPVALPKDKAPDKKIIRQIIGTLLTREWPFVHPDSLAMAYHTSSGNAHCPPLKVFIKFHKETGAEIEIFKHLVPGKHKEALFCYEYGQIGLGAKVYGFFKTQDGAFGRIDEFLDARNLQPEDVENAIIRADIARGLTQLHAMKNSLKKKAIELYYGAIINGLDSYHKMDKLKALGREGGVNVDALIDYNFGARLRKVVNRLKSMGGKTGLCIHDVQFMNVLVKNDPKKGESKITLVDFEFVMQNYRAFDIGEHFMQKMFKWFNAENKLADCRKYTKEERYTSVLMESELGYLLAITFDVHNMLCIMYEEDDKNPLNLIGLNKLFDEFMDQYTKLGLEGL
ncbi:choline/ethanolamine kinase [Truncatella angustata]|uniref:Choline/ethanolamine kinase n=1 Tax=Truncatella angustata TaxID=152316 RepID=A0A9P8ZTV7_9PEZI|nr:choline/ethanolamine kinase [Truncatella angustata]KAH6649190.1 choline/ethanolamine kinase [Truncatella angustata]